MKQFKKWDRIGPLAFTVDGTSNGIATVASTFGFWKSQKVIVKATGLDDKRLEVKRVLSRTELLLGPQDGSDTNFSAIDLYTTALSASVEAPEQAYDVPADEGAIFAAVFESHPVAALRSALVDEWGDRYTASNPLPVQLSDGSVNIETLNAQLEVHLQHNGSDYDSVRIGDGTDLLAVNADGSINVMASVSSLPAGLATEAKQDVGNNLLSSIDAKVTTDYALQLDDTSTPNMTYVGYAALGSAGSAAVWRIKRIDETTGMTITWADSNDSFDNIWNNRTSLTYG